MSVAAQLAAFVCDAEPDAASAPAHAIMRLSLYDWAVCGMAGAGEPVASIVRASKVPGTGATPVFGSEQRYTPADAALINGAASHALDYDDTHFAHIGHPSVAVLPAALAVATDFDAFLWAALIGAEVSIRVGEWLGRSHYQTGFHQTATAGAFGATAAAGLQFGLSAAQLEAAFGLAATQAAGLKSQFGTMGKPYHAGLAARTGVEAARLALAGFDTRGAGMDGLQGFGPTHHGEGNLSAFDTLGQDWRMETVSHKFHACCHGLHAMLEALADLPPGADHVTVHTHPRWLSVCNIETPRTGLETKFSYKHAAALAMSGYDTASLSSYTDALAAEQSLADYRSRVTVIADETIAETATKVVARGGGGQDTVRVHDLGDPLPLDIRTGRLRKKGAALIGDLEPRLWAATGLTQTPEMNVLTQIIQQPLPANLA